MVFNITKKELLEIFPKKCMYSQDGKLCKAAIDPVYTREDPKNKPHDFTPIGYICKKNHVFTIGLVETKLGKGKKEEAK
jgi:hypothetical protein